MAVMTPRERRTERKNRGGAALDMNLVSLIDVFTILIFFLLSSATGVETLVSPKAVDLPLANAETAPRQTVLLVVSGDDILVEGRRGASHGRHRRRRARAASRAAGAGPAPSRAQ
jgi:biopolymer transport protein TolR